MEYKRCTRCVSDTTINGISFDEKGVCNFCKTHDRLEKEYPLGTEGEKNLDELIKKIKNKGKNKKYDCVVGLSGGTDSTYCLYLSKKMGLRPLVVHFDNGWNSDIAEQNIKKTVEKLGVGLKTVKCDENEFKDLQRSFLKASVPEAEIPTDVAIHAILCQVAAEQGITFVLNGHSFRTEGVAPISWTYMDGKYIQSVQNRFGKIPLKTFPNMTFLKAVYFLLFKNIKVIPFLNYLNYSKSAAGKELKEKLDWTYYGGHHFESIYTRFIIAHLLYNKFGIDKRIINFSAHIRSGLMDRDEALKELEQKPEISQDIIEKCIKEIGLTADEFEKIMNSPLKSFLDYPTYYNFLKTIKIPIKIACAANILPDLFYQKYFK